MARRSPVLRNVRRATAALAAALGLAGLALAQGDGAGDGTGGGAAGPRAEDGRPLALVAGIDGAIGPPVARQIAELIETGEARGAAIVILRMDTPGGLTTSTRDINKAILAAGVPVATYVAPAGSRAASAGTYILYASHVAAMAPGTNVGAATPVQMGGGGPPGMPGGQPSDRPQGDGPGDGGGGDGAEEGGPSGEDGPAEEAPAPAPQGSAGQKAVNDAVAQIVALAELRGRNAEWAEKAVREAASLSASAALEQNVIEVVAADLETLLERIDGREVRLGETPVTLATAGARIEVIEPSLVTEILGILSNPNVALLLMTLGFYGIIFELSSPGLGPGIFGAICLLLGLYSLNLLPIDYTGLALVGLGLALMTAEAVTPTFGALGLGGVVAFVLGAAILVDTDAPQYQISWGLIGAIAGVSFLVCTVMIGAIWRTRSSPVRTGAGAMLGTPGRVMDWQEGAGHVFTHGERWEARGPEGLAPGDTVEVAGMEGLTLIVRRAGAADAADTEEETA